MYNIFFSENVQARVSEYSRQYRTYYEALYLDSGIWAEEQIIDGYIRESLQRESEIYSTIAERLSGKYDILISQGSTTYIRWRSKYLFITWEDDKGDRVITHLEIR